jgi:hypothetical protein
VSAVGHTPVRLTGITADVGGEVTEISRAVSKRSLLPLIQQLQLPPDLIGMLPQYT